MSGTTPQTGSGAPQPPPLSPYPPRPQGTASAPATAGGGTMATGAGAGPGGAAGSTNVTSTAPPSSQLNQIVTDYLLKRGFTQTERVFRKESADLGPDGRPRHDMDKMSPKRYAKAFHLLSDWVENSLDVYKFEMRKLLWPVFVYSFIELVQGGYADEAKNFLASFRSRFEDIHGDALREFTTASLPQHLQDNNLLRLYKSNKYRIPLHAQAEGILLNFLEREADRGGVVIAALLNEHCQLDRLSRGPIEVFSFEAIYRRAQNMDLEEADLQEGIPGVFTGISNKDILDAKGPLKLGPLPMDPELRDDVRAELEEEDQRNPPADGRPTLVEEFDRKIKREESDDVPSRADLPLPPSRARDVVMEMQKMHEYRERFRIEGRTGGVGVPVSVCMFTFHNTLGSVSCMDFSKDHQLVAVGTMDSYIRVWSLDGKPLKSKMPHEKDLKVNNRKLIGHSGPVYGVSFSDAIMNSDRNVYEGERKEHVETNAKLLLSCSADGQIRLWSLDVWSCLCIYKAHDGPVFRVLWGPHGHYFASAGWDKTVRVFMQDHASAQRIMVGHDTSISALAWHPNGTYVFSASDEMDKTIRMWSVVTGACVRVFTGHTDYISALECAHNGRLLASADAGGNIFLWDIEKGTRIKRCRGHGKGGIPSLSFSVESNVLVSGGLDGTVRIWDVELPADPSKAGALSVAQSGQQTDGGAAAGGAAVAAAGASTTTATTTNASAGGGADGATTGADSRTITVGGAGGQASQAAATSGTAGGVVGTGTGKKKGKEVQITPDQISAFPTKKTPVMKVQFTRMNLVIAGGCYDPER